MLGTQRRSDSLLPRAFRGESLPGRSHTHTLIVVAIGMTTDESATVLYLHARLRNVQRVGHFLPGGKHRANGHGAV